YFALSYVWGADPEPLVSTVESIGLLCQPGSLEESSELGRRLPKTIRDAMTVTRELGTRYLWVDRLCIVQDDPVQKPSLLAAMAAIYGNASVTLIAA
ncbi:heterokaryon incompatibility, partial [Schizothecium vesticola]